MHLSPEFWAGLFKIISVNILLSGDNAVVIALASRSLPAHLRNRAIWLGSLGAIVLLLVFALFIIQLLAIPFLKIAGAAALLWIGVKMLIPEDEDEEAKEDKGGGTVWSAVRTIIIADAVMSLDNVIAIAAAANGNVILIAVGLGISVPVIIYGSTLILKILIRFPMLVTVGAGLIGWIAGEVWLTDPVVSGWAEALIAAQGQWIETASAGLGAGVVIVLGLVIARRVKAKRGTARVVDLATEETK